MATRDTRGALRDVLERAAETRALSVKQAAVHGPIA